MRKQELCLTEANKMQRMSLNSYFLLVLLGNAFNIKKMKCDEVSSTVCNLLICDAEMNGVITSAMNG